MEGIPKGPTTGKLPNGWSIPRIQVGPSLLLGIVVVAACLVLLSTSRKSRLMPIYIPIEVGITVSALQRGGMLPKILYLLRRYGRPFFGISARHQITHNLADSDRFLSQSHHALDNIPVSWNMYVRCLGVQDSKTLYDKYFAASRELLIAVEKEFLNETGTIIAIERGDIKGKVAKLVSFSTQPREFWEQRAAPKLLQDDVVELDLASAVRDLTAHVALEVIYGKDFVDRCGAHFIPDMWYFMDNAFLPLLVGLPTWLPFNSIRNGVAACTRLRDRLADLFRRIEQYQSGQPVDYNADMSDLSTTALERNKTYRKYGFNINERADIEIGIVFGQNANTPVMTFWFLVTLYTVPGLLPLVREEISPYITISGANNTSNEIASLDHVGLYKQCPLFKSALFETVRVSGGSVPMRYVSRPVPATMADGSKHMLQPGTWVSVPDALSNNNPSIYPSPKDFIPERFIEVNERTGEKVARYGRLKGVWGSGAGVCRGRTYAIMEALSICAGFISLWDVEALDGGPLQPPPKDPHRKMPVNGWRVRVKRRAYVGPT
ncbi:Cytochrome P450 [Macrophomina phaseolina MS6]|uniref:Cytochrome P450 n=1 Tax=Macrophomina phaseolina (strain MS6) TaxID=1126212 RepID=K2RTW3_MACPH|nr:Cytochrome P450 [Macrophomina phaseolina MS6]